MSPRIHESGTDCLPTFQDGLDSQAHVTAVSRGQLGELGML